MKKLTLFLVLFLFTCFSIKAQNRNIEERTFMNLDSALAFPDAVQHLILNDRTLNSIEGIGKLKNLKTLEIYNAPLKDIPAELSQLASLKKITINFCPEINWNNAFHFIDSLTSLEVLVLRNNNITDFPATVSDLKLLKHLDLSGNNIAEFPATIKNFKELEELVILDNPNMSYSQRGNNFNGLKKLKNVYFTVNENNIDLLGAFPSVEELELFGEIKEELPDLKNLNKLKHIRLNNIMTSNYSSLFRKLATAPALEKLSVINDSLSVLPSEINLLENLELLYVQGKMFSTLFQSECTLPELKTIILNQSDSLDFKGLVNNVYRLKKLKNIDLRYNSITEIPENINLLSHRLELNLANNNISNLNKKITKMRNLNRLVLTYNPLNDYQVLSFRSYMPWCKIEFNLSGSYYRTVDKINNTSTFERLFSGAVSKERQRLDSERGDTLFFRNAFTLQIPPFAFLLPNGLVFKGKVDIDIEQYTNPAEIYASGLPMFIKTGDSTVALQSGGMFTIKAFGDSIELQPNPENLITVNIASVNQNPEMNIYSLSDNGWQQTGTMAPPKVLNERPTPPVFPSYESSKPVNFFELGNYLMTTEGKYDIAPNESQFYSVHHPSIFIKTDIDSEANKTFRLRPYLTESQENTPNLRSNSNDNYPEMSVLTHYIWKVVGYDSQNDFEVIKGVRTSEQSCFFTIQNIELSYDSTFLNLNLRIVDSLGISNEVVSAKPIYAIRDEEEIKKLNAKLVQNYFLNIQQRVALWERQDSLCLSRNFDLEAKIDKMELLKRNYTYRYDRTATLSNSLFANDLADYMADSAAYYQSEEFKEQKEIYEREYAEYLNLNRAWLIATNARFNNSTANVAVRNFALENFGTINCDYFYRVQQPQIISSSFTDNDGNLLTYVKAIIFNESAVNFIEYGAGQSIQYDSQAVNSLLLILEDDKIAFISKANFPKINAEPEVKASIYDLNSMTFSTFIADVFSGTAK